LIQGLFIAGTGTDVGKTMVTAGVLRWLLARGSNAMGMKPVQTGCKLFANGRRSAPDVDFVLRAAQLAPDAETRSHLAPYCFEPACSPHLAARMAGESISLERILASARWLAERYRPLVVEGAGGLAVPLNESETMLDLIVALGLPVLLVGRADLGTINHTLLSLEALRQRGCRVLGILLNDVHPVFPTDRYIHDDNVRAIVTYGKIASVARIPYLGQPPRMELLDLTLGSCEFLLECMP
jgi:dethiobiotin synthase